MCGISGVVDFNSSHKPDEIWRMTQEIHHRGPDGEGYVLLETKSENNFLTLFGPDTIDHIIQYETAYQPKSNIKNCDTNFKLAFGHRRLSILDLSPRGHMPMCDETQNFWMTYNGEVYNFEEIREQLKTFGHTFKTDGDSEVVLKSFIQWGPSCLDKFMGMFAIAIYDLKSKMLFLARDRFGIKPLYYYTSTEGTFYFASEIKQFRKVSSWKSSINYTRASDYLFYSLTDHTDETMFDGVHQILPSNYFFGKIEDLPQKNNQKINTVCWYKINPKPVNLNFEEACDEFKKLFEQSVALHLKADVAVGSALSGGLDSSAIVCQVNEFLKEEGKTHLQKTFSSIANDERYSEEDWMKKVVEKVKVDAFYVYPSPERVKALSPELIRIMDEPYQSQSAYLGYHVFEEAAKNNVKVLLNGQGADEYLSAYTEFRFLRLKKLIFSGEIQKVVSELGQSGMSKSASYKTILELVVKSILPQSLLQKISGFSTENRQLNQIINWSDFGGLSSAKHPLSDIVYKTNNTVEISKLMLYHTALPKYLRWEDRNSMAHSVEARVPFLDHRLVEFALSLPLELLNQPGMGPKPLLTESLSEILPPAIRNRMDKKGFITPEEAWFKDHNNPFFDSILDVVLNESSYNRNQVEQFLIGMRKGDIPFSYAYWRLYSFSLWKNQLLS
jgi:asparagine synthase (glutamine-hydrolysing)